MEEKKVKKKQTLTISSKKPYRTPSYTGGSQKKSFVIEKKISGKKNNRRFYSRNDNENVNQQSLGQKKPFPSGKISSNNITPNRNFEIRKKAEERAKKRFKNPAKEEISHLKKSTLAKNKSSISKRE